MIDELAVLLNQEIPAKQGNVMVHCPFHVDRRASLSLNLTRGVWWCHACGMGGGVRRLAQLLGGELDKADLTIRTLDLEPAKEEPDFSEIAIKCEDQITDYWNLPPIVKQYLDHKDLDQDVPAEFRLGYDLKRNAITIPYWDQERCVSIQYRYADGSKNQEPGGKRILYNVDALRGETHVILCEGESDTHRMWTEVGKWGHSIAVGGVPGAQSGNQRWELWSLDLLWAEKVWIAFDADEAGDKGAEKALQVLGEKATRLRPRGGKDWCDPETKWDFLEDLYDLT